CWHGGFHRRLRCSNLLCLAYRPGAATTTGGVRYVIGKAVTAATTNGALLPFNWTQVVKVTPGEQLSTVSNDGIGGTLVVVELTT
ncbi:MAG: hypothetical protein WB685_22265, partial [Pseudolabrys sp.]